MTLVEALIAFVVAAFGMLAMLGAQSALHLHGDVTRQRAEAVQLAQADIEQMRAYASMPVFAGLAAQAVSVPSNLSSDTVFTLQRHLVVQGNLLLAEVDVQWPDRAGSTASIGLASMVAGVDPSLSGRLGTPPARATDSNALGRAGPIPTQSTDLGDGRSAFLPPGGGGAAWVFDNNSGIVTSLCSVAPGATQADLTAGQLTGCTTAAAWPLTGYVRFSTGAAVTAANAESPASLAQALTMALSLTEGSATPPACHDDAGSQPGQTAVAYYCLVTPDATSHHWSGRLDVQPLGWTVGNTGGSYRVCRYSADYDAIDGVTNNEHPATYASVTTPLTNQNFLVIAGPNACPTDVRANPAAGDMVDSNTVEQAPNLTATPLS